MALQHAENLFRRYLGQAITVKTISGGVYAGRVAEVTHDFVELIEARENNSARVFLLFQAIESMTVDEPSSQ